ncbi:MAG TPA: MarR family winged helix-turn-helix transcriptional regulator, partial [Casimicrobiaceae bacterium]|nr:MarR family winged helix-turn-helix transcriptional regulator [Casimicrobiaceae bacterium]
PPPAARTRGSRPATAAPAWAARPRDDGMDLARRLGLDAVPPWASYVHRGRRECAFSQLKLVGRVVNTLYDKALEPVGLRANQLALMWAIVAMEPVDLTSLGAATLTDQTTLSRTVENLRRSRLVSVRPGSDRRVKELRLTAAGKARFAAALPYWDKAQREASRMMSLDVVNALGRQVRRAMREPA